MIRTNRQERVRLNLELTPELKVSLVELQKRTAASSVSEVLRRSVAMYDMVTEHLSARGSVILKNADGSQETLRII